MGIQLTKSIRQCFSNDGEETENHIAVEHIAQSEQQEMLGREEIESNESETALPDAVIKGNTNGVKPVFEQGAESKPNHPGSDKDVELIHAVAKRTENSFQLALKERDVKILLEEGSNPNVAAIVRLPCSKTCSCKPVNTTALHAAVRRGWTEGVRMLIEAGAKCISSERLQNPLIMAMRWGWPPDLIELLLRHGAGNCKVEAIPSIHTVLGKMYEGDDFLPQLLEWFFLHGGNINIRDKYNKDRTALQYVVSEGHPMNAVRWLIRHGADILPPGMSKEADKAYIKNHFPALLLLLKAGMRFSPGAKTHLNNIEVELSALFNKGGRWDGVFERRLQGMWTKLVEEQVNIQTIKFKSTSPEYCVQQMADLLEFSDESLHVYPDDTYPCSTADIRQRYHRLLGLVHEVLEFLSQPQSLQWHCRLCVRESLVSLQPSVVKTLPMPSRLKCYILCHEV